MTSFEFQDSLLSESNFDSCILLNFRCHAISLFARQSKIIIQPDGELTFSRFEIQKAQGVLQERIFLESKRKIRGVRF